MLTSVAVWSCSVSAPALFSSLLKNKAVTILCAVFFFFYCLPHTGLYEKLYAHYSLTLFITENSVAVTVWARR